jgi:hypothetical protein
MRLEYRLAWPPALACSRKLFDLMINRDQSRQIYSWWAGAPEAANVRVRERVLIPTGRSIPIAWHRLDTFSPFA